MSKNVNAKRRVLNVRALRAAALAALAVAMPTHVALAGTEVDVADGTTDLVVTAGPSNDVTFTGTYNSPNFSVSTTITIGTLNDLSSTALTITDVNAITLNGGTNSVSVLNGGAAADLLFVGTGANLTINTPLTLTTTTANGNFDIVGTSNIGGVISGTGFGFTKTGAGTLTLSGTNTYTGPTAIAGGTLSISSDLNLGAVPAAVTPGQLALNGGTLATTSTFTLNSNRGIALGTGGGTVNTVSGTLTYGGIIAGTTGLTKKPGAGTLILGGVNTYTGGTAINGGAISVAADTALGGAGTITLNGGTLVTTAGVTTTIHAINIGASGGTITINSAQQLYLNGANLLTGSGPLTVSGTYTDAAPGSGNLRLGSANTYNGAITIQGGSVEYGVLNAVAAASTFTVNGPGELITNNGVALSNAVAVNGGTLSFENGNAGSFTGPITVGAGGIRVGLRDWYSVGNARGGTISGAITGTSDMTVVAGTGGLATLTLSGNNTGYSGNYQVQSGNNILFGTANSRGTGTITINTDAARLGGVGFGYDFGTTPAFINALSGTTVGGVFGN